MKLGINNRADGKNIGDFAVSIDTACIRFQFHALASLRFAVEA